MRAVHVIWEDSAVPHSNWMPWDEARAVEPLVIESVGYVVKSSKKHLVLAGSHDGQGAAPGVNGCISIPRSAIKKLRRIAL